MKDFFSARVTQLPPWQQQAAVSPSSPTAASDTRRKLHLQGSLNEATN